jgi:hypothetical protein
MSTYTYTYAYTRAQAIVDQVSVLFAEAGIDDADTSKVCHGVREKWLEAVGLYLKRDGHRVYEVEARIHWASHSDLAQLDFEVDLPGWEGTASPEAVILGRRFANVAARERLEAHYWVRFTAAIRADPSLHRELCPSVGVVYGGRVADWKSNPTTRSLRLQDLGEVGLSERSAL